MLKNVKALNGYRLSATDGDIGKVKEFYFDDKHWTVRYLVAETGGWLLGKQVLISPYALLDIDVASQCINIALTKKQIADSPTLPNDRPVSRQFENSYYGYYGYPPYWGGSHVWGDSPELMRDPVQWAPRLFSKQDGDPNLRSTHDVTGHYIEALDGAVGHVVDFIIDDKNWTIRYFVVSTQNILPGKKVLISTEWIKRVSWIEQKVFINLTCEAIKNSPTFTDAILPNRDNDFEREKNETHRGIA